MTSVLLLSAAVSLGACSGISVQSEWQEGAPHGQSFSRVLIVGVSPDYNLRCAFEQSLASQVRSDATQAFSSCDSMRAEEKLTRENLERVIAAVHADAVLATTLVAHAGGVQEGGTRDTRGYGRYKALDFGIGVYGLPVTYAQFETAPPLSTLKTSVHILTKMYETRGATLLYTLDTVAKSLNLESTQSTILTIASPTADRLRRDGLIH
ncbi:MAG TPA: hypothetical protein VLW26_00640 [Steroidobacteraceae bacterium]|nr:hypothetical protein [Steroidobacteraceae bacterium]